MKDSKLFGEALKIDNFLCEHVLVDTSGKNGTIIIYLFC